MKKTLLFFTISISTLFGSIRYDYTIQDVIEYYNMHKQIQINESGWLINGKQDYFDRKIIYFNGQISKFGKCTDVDNCEVTISIPLDYSNLSGLNFHIYTSYKNVVELKKLEKPVFIKATCNSDKKGTMKNCHIHK